MNTSTQTPAESMSSHPAGVADWSAVQEMICSYLELSLTLQHPTMSTTERDRRLYIARNSSMEGLLDLLSMQLERMSIADLRLLTGVSLRGVMKHARKE